MFAKLREKERTSSRKVSTTINPAANKPKPAAPRKPTPSPPERVIPEVRPDP